MNRFALSWLGGPSSQVDRLQVNFLQSWLEGEALGWYNRHVVGSNQAITHWYFFNIIEGLYDQFVHASSMQDAREALRKQPTCQQWGYKASITPYWIMPKTWPYTLMTIQYWNNS